MCAVAWGPPWPLPPLNPLNQTPSSALALPLNALDTMRALAIQGEVHIFEAGDLIFRAGETGECMYGLLEGTVELTWNGNAGQELIQAGDVFGAGALVTQEHCMLHRLCGPPSIHLSFNLAAVLPRRST